MESINTHLYSEGNASESGRKLVKLLTNSNSLLNSIGLLLLRCVLGGILFVVGSGKVFGWFGGYGLSITLQFYEKSGFSHFLAYLSIFTEFLGGLLITTGFLTRPVAIAVIINMLVATITMLPSGFLGPSGASYPFIFLVMAVVIFLTGPMELSVDAHIFRKEIK